MSNEACPGDIQEGVMHGPSLPVCVCKAKLQQHRASIQTRLLSAQPSHLFPTISPLLHFFNFFPLPFVILSFSSPVFSPGLFLSLGVCWPVAAGCIYLLGELGSVGLNCPGTGCVGPEFLMKSAAILLSPTSVNNGIHQWLWRSTSNLREEYSIPPSSLAAPGLCRVEDNNRTKMYKELLLCE